MISQTAEYALRAMVHLAESGPVPIPTDVIARNTRAPFGYLVKIMARLSHAGLVNAQRGRHGGFILGRDPQEISLFDVLEVADGHHRPLTCPQHDTECPLYHHLRIGCQKSLDYWRATPLSRLTKKRRLPLLKPNPP